MNAAQTIDIPSLIDRSKISRFQIVMLSLCGLCVLMDGFDVQAIGYVAPAILQDWKIDKAALGPVFGAGLVGLLVGSMLLSMLADRLGRRPVLIAATFAFAAGMLLTTQVTTVTELLWIRFVTGLGLGAILPNAMALAGEYSPLRKRVTILMSVSVCFTVGAVVAGFVAAVMMPQWHWQSVFLVGGCIPLVLAGLMLVYVPESLQFLVLRNQHSAAGRWLKRLKICDVDVNVLYRVNESRQKGLSVVALFKEGRARMTLLIWAANFMNLINLNFLSNWLPTIVKDAGLSMSTAVLAGTGLQVGGMVGALVLGLFIDRSSFRRVLIPCFLVAAVSIFFIGRPGLSLLLLLTSIIVSGVCIVGGQSALNALAASYYPTTLRSTGVGWSLGVGRMGSILGPVLGGELIRLNWPVSTIFVVVAVPALCSALLIWGMDREHGSALTNAHSS